MNNRFLLRKSTPPDAKASLHCVKRPLLREKWYDFLKFDNGSDKGTFGLCWARCSYRVLEPRVFTLSARINFVPMFVYDLFLVALELYCAKMIQAEIPGL